MILRRLRRRPSTWFLAAGALGLVAALMTFRVAARTPTAPVVVAGDVIPAGTPVAAAPLVIRSVPSGVAALPGVIGQMDLIAGRRFAVTVGAGEPVTQASLGGDPAVAPRPLAVGERAVSIPAVTAGAALPALVPGARVDVAAPSVSGAATIVVRNGEVIARQDPDPSTGSGADGGVLLRVDEADAVRLGAAIDGSAGIRILIRPFDEGGDATP